MQPWRVRLRDIAGAVLLLAMASVCLAAEPLQSSLIDAVKSRRVDAVRGLLTRANVNSRLNDGSTPLHWAAYQNDPEIAELLLGAGADPNAVNDLGVSPLWLAAANGSVPLASMFLDARADPNVAPETGGTPLMRALRSGNGMLVTLLIARGANVNATEGSRKQTALMYAVSLRQPAMVRVLLDAGADLRARSRVWKQRFLLCCNQDSGIIEPDLDVMVSKGGTSALLFAARVGDVESAKMLLDAGADVNDKAPDGSSALVTATWGAHVPLVEMLLQRGADPNHAEAGQTAMHVAVLRENLPLVKTLLARGADVNARITRGTPATRRGRRWAFNQAWVGATPLWLAAGLGNAELMRLLVARGANPRLRPADGGSLLMAAAYNISPRSVPDSGRWRRRRESDVLVAVRLALELGDSVSEKDTRGQTALHKAADARYPAVVQFLAERGADVNAKDALAQTPLDLALSCLPCHRNIGIDLALTFAEEARGREPTSEALRKVGGTADNVLGNPGLTGGPDPR